MFQIEKTETGCAVSRNGAALFAVEAAALFTQEGRLALSPDGQTEAIRFAGESGALALSFQTDGTYLKINCYAELFEKSPVFGTQNTFPPHGSAELVLRFAGSGETPCLAVYQHKDWWMRPSMLPGLSGLPRRSQMVLFQQGKEYIHLLAPCGQDSRADLCGENGCVTIRLSTNRGGQQRVNGPAVVIAACADPYKGAELAVRAALPERAQSREKAPLPELFHSLGWCSWDAFYHKVNAEGLYQKAAEWKAKSVPVKWVLIDDGWLDIREQRLWSFAASKEKFPQGLKEAVRRLKEDFGVSYVGVWHTLAGYWNGVHPDGPIARQLSGSLCQNARGSLLPYPQREKSFAFFDAFYTVLEDCGIDFVKVDGQSSLANFLEGDFSFGEASRETLLGLQKAAELHFHGTVIHCMGMAPQEIWNRSGGAVSRTSDDYVPQEKDGFAEHALQNGYTSLWHGSLFWGDLDMFWTHHPQAQMHAVLRAVSGGPVYISDPVGETSPEVLAPLLLDGRLLRCSGSPVPARDCLLEDLRVSGRALKVLNSCGESWVAAVFSLSAGENTYSLSMEDAPGCDAPLLAVFDCLREEVFLLKSGEKRELALSENRPALYSMVPVADGFAVFGLAGKYLPGATVEGLRTERKTDAAVKEFWLAGKGQLAFYATHKPLEVTRGGQRIKLREAGGGLYLTEENEETGELRVVLRSRSPGDEGRERDAGCCRD